MDFWTSVSRALAWLIPCPWILGDLVFLTLNSSFLNSERSLGCSWSCPPALWAVSSLQSVNQGNWRAYLSISLLLGIAVLCWLLSSVWKTLLHIFCPTLICFKLRRKIQSLIRHHGHNSDNTFKQWEKWNVDLKSCFRYMYTYTWLSLRLWSKGLNHWFWG